LANFYYWAALKLVKLFIIGDGNSRALQNVDNHLRDYMVSHPR